MRPTRDQVVALKRVFDRRPLGISYLRFRRGAFMAFDSTLMVKWEGMTLGIEPDGYTHS